MQHDGQPSLGNLPGRFGTGEAAADDVDWFGHGGRIGLIVTASKRRQHAASFLPHCGKRLICPQNLTPEY
jgi:hypothetical protein